MYLGGGAGDADFVEGRQEAEGGSRISYFFNICSKSFLQAYRQEYTHPLVLVNMPNWLLAISKVEVMAGMWT